MNISPNQFYVRNKQGCHEYNTGTGLFINELQGKSTGSDAVSVALEEFVQGGKSQAHVHDKSEEYQVILSGRGTLFIGNQSRTVTVGDLIKIPAGKTHRTLNEDPETLTLYCLVAPAWTIEGTKFVDPSVSDDEIIEIYMRRKETCKKIIAANGEAICRVLLGKEDGPCDALSIAHVKLKGECSLDVDLHPEAEQSYIILEGQGRLVVDGETKTVIPGDLARIPKGKMHQIFNDHKETLKFYYACTPALTPNSLIKV